MLPSIASRSSLSCETFKECTKQGVHEEGRNIETGDLVHQQSRIVRVTDHDLSRARVVCLLHRSGVLADIGFISLDRRR
jgi:hypothetical protein